MNFNQQPFVPVTMGWLHVAASVGTESGRLALSHTSPRVRLLLHEDSGLLYSWSFYAWRWRPKDYSEETTSALTVEVGGCEATKQAYFKVLLVPGPLRSIGQRQVLWLPPRSRESTTPTQHGLMVKTLSGTYGERVESFGTIMQFNTPPPLDKVYHLGTDTWLKLQSMENIYSDQSRSQFFPMLFQSNFNLVKDSIPW